MTNPRELVFTDEDLKRLKDELKYCFEWHNHSSCYVSQSVNRLLDRLEAAEKMATHIELNLPKFTSKILRAYWLEWRKTAGK